MAGTWTTRRPDSGHCPPAPRPRRYATSSALRTSESGDPGPEHGPSGLEKGTMNETETHETAITTTTTGAVIAAEAPTPVTAAEEFIKSRGSFASVYYPHL